MGRKGYPAEFRRRALDLVAAGKTVAEVARLPIEAFWSRIQVELLNTRRWKTRVESRTRSSSTSRSSTTANAATPVSAC